MSSIHYYQALETKHDGELFFIFQLFKKGFGPGVMAQDPLRKSDFDSRAKGKYGYGYGIKKVKLYKNYDIDAMSVFLTFIDV